MMKGPPAVRLVLACALALPGTPIAWAQSVARPDDARTCATQDGRTALDACTRAIASRRFNRGDLALLHYRRALLLREAGEFDRAIADFGVAIHLNGDAIPTAADAFDLRIIQRNAYALRGRTFEDKSDYDRALADYAALVAADPRDQRALILRAGVFAKQGECGRAIVDYAAAVEIDPKAWDGLLGRARCYAKLGDRERAIADYRGALSGEVPEAVKPQILSELQALGAAP